MGEVLRLVSVKASRIFSNSRLTLVLVESVFPTGITPKTAILLISSTSLGVWLLIILFASPAIIGAGITTG